MGIADERGFYFDDLSLYKYILHDKDNNDFPDYPWANFGKKFKEANDNIIIKANIGLFGYHSGTEKTIIDRCALADPLLARLPALEPWRIGHFRREIPDGYRISVADGIEVIDNPKLNEFYKMLKIITQDKDLFAPRRIKTIFLINLGAYNHLLPR